MRPRSKHPARSRRLGAALPEGLGQRTASRIRRFPRLPNAPFRIDAPPVGMSADQVLLSPIHAYYHNIEQINGGRNDMFAAMSTVGG